MTPHDLNTHLLHTPLNCGPHTKSFTREANTDYVPAAIHARDEMLGNANKCAIRLSMSQFMKDHIPFDNDGFKKKFPSHIIEEIHRQLQAVIKQDHGADPVHELVRKPEESERNVTKDIGNSKTGGRARGKKQLPLEKQISQVFVRPANVMMRSKF